MRKLVKVFSLIMILALCFSNFSLATTVTDVTGETSQVTGEDVESALIEGGKQVTNGAVMVMGVVSSISLPICALLCLWGAVMYFILGIRNLYKKRQGMLLMWGSLTFLVVAKVAYCVVWIFTIA